MKHVEKTQVAGVMVSLWRLHPQSLTVWPESAVMAFGHMDPMQVGNEEEIKKPQKKPQQNNLEQLSLKSFRWNY